MSLRCSVKTRNGCSRSPKKWTPSGQLWVVGVGEDGVMAFTDDGIENLTNLIAIHKDDPSIIKKRCQVLAAMIKPKNEESDEV
jgi:hypothetical protein